MEIKLKNVLLENFNSLINFDIKSEKITSIIPNNLDIISIINQRIIDGEIYFNKTKINKNSSTKQINQLKNKIYVFDNSEILFSVTNFEDIRVRVTNISDDLLEEYLAMFNLDKAILSKNYTQISSSEKSKILLISALMSNKKLIILNNPELYLDDKSILMLIKELKRLKKQKSIIIISNDLEFLLLISDNILTFDKNNKLIFGNKYEILSNKTIIKNLGAKMPEILEFINRTLELKKIKLSYRDNVNDTLKDIYRSAKNN